MRHLVVFVGVFLLCSGLAAYGAAMGDVDGDGVLTILDVRLCHQMWLDVIPCPGDCSTLDFNADGAFDESDCFYISFVLVASPPTPEIGVKRSDGSSVADGGSDQLGNYIPGTTTIDLRYTVENTSDTAALTVSGVSASNLSNCSHFTTAIAFPQAVPANGSAALDVSFQIDGGGPFSLDLEIENDDSNENPYVIHVSGRRCVDIVSFDDPGLEAAVRDAVGKPTGPLYDCDVDSLKFLNASYRGISNLGGIDRLAGLQTLKLGENAIVDITPLAGLTGLETLELHGNGITTIGALSSLVNLRVLHLAENAFTTIDALTALTGLETLGLGANAIADFGSLASLTGLRYLDLEDTDIADIGVLTGLSDLRTLYLWGNRVVDIGVLAGLIHLVTLDLSANRIADIAPLVNLTRLEFLDLSWNTIVAIDALAGLTALEDLDLQSNDIVDIGALVVNSTAGGLGPGDDVDLRSNPLSPGACADVSTLRINGVTVELSPGICP